MSHAPPSILITSSSVEWFQTIHYTCLQFRDEENKEDKFYCVECHHFLLTGYMFPCGHYICRQCRSTTFNPGGICPAWDNGYRNSACRRFWSMVTDIREDKALKRDVASLEIHCPNQNMGCKAIIQIQHLEIHLDVCPYIQLPIHSLEQVEEILVNAIENPTLEKENESDILLSIIVNIHTLATDLQTLEDENARIGKRIGIINDENGDLMKEASELQKANEDLKSKNEELLNKVANHENDIVQLKNTASTLQDEYRDIYIQDEPFDFERVRQEVTLFDNTLNDFDSRLLCIESATYDSQIVWRLTEFREHLERAKQNQIVSLFSQPFYDGVKGYKMCCRVFPDGCGDENKGEYVSFFFVLMKGACDEFLEWPFKKRITLEVKSWDNSPDISKTLIPYNGRAYSRPVAEMNLSAGESKFISQNELNSYLKSDTIYLTCRVDDIPYNHV